MHGLALPAAGGAADGASLFGLSLCAGAGGLDLGLLLAFPGYRAVGYVERDAYAAAVLVARMEDAALEPAPVWDDVLTFDGRSWRGGVDLVAAGYPCQPFSLAGRRRGADDPRHLWPHVARIVGECEPPFVVLENVAHHLRLGFPEVARELVGLGYRLAAGLFTAAEAGAPHRRERLFVLGRREGEPLADPARLLGPAVERRQPDGARAALGEAGAERRAWPPGPGDRAGWAEYLRTAPDLEPAVRRGADGLAHRVDRLRLCGQGVVPLAAAHAVRALAAELLADAAGGLTP